MKLLLALLSSLALTSVVYAEQQDQQNNKKKNQGQNHPVQQQQIQQQKQLNKQNKHVINQQQHVQHLENKHGKHLENQDQHVEHVQNKKLKHEGNQAQHEEHLQNKQDKHLAHQEQHKQHEFKKFETSKGWKKGVESEKFVQGKHIKGSENWHGEKYAAFKNYHCEWHDHDWWHNHYPTVVLISGGWYYQNAGFWFPAWGYDPGYTYYPYDGPIYAYHNLPPDQVIANVQAVLQEEGFYQGEVDGLLGPLTRAAIASYQEANGLYVTSAIDEPTIEALGLS